ncbi:hypothetical protein DCAR_0206552 [Daucus carota subsp. sativus]|uniref:Uncharacterized protein n=1 Tax=Daucus carota subsp. sativus TaxID=79200 RepID=A0A161Y6H0_DAUCS|nr:hypothetical protein DCAR_0206552 [Daucus carota subsp. sativus]
MPLFPPHGQAPRTPNFEYDIERHEGLRQSYECLNNYCNYRILPVNERPANSVKLTSKTSVVRKAHGHRLIINH